MGCMKERTILNDQQTQVMMGLKQKGYVMVTKKQFMVVLPVD